MGGATSPPTARVKERWNEPLYHLLLELRDGTMYHYN